MTLFPLMGFLNVLGSLWWVIMGNILLWNAPWRFQDEFAHTDSLVHSRTLFRCVSLLAGLSHYSVLIVSGLTVAACLVVGLWVMSHVCLCVFVILIRISPWKKSEEIKSSIVPTQRLVICEVTWPIEQQQSSKNGCLRSKIIFCWWTIWKWWTYIHPVTCSMTSNDCLLANSRVWLILDLWGKNSCVWEFVEYEIHPSTNIICFH